MTVPVSQTAQSLDISPDLPRSTAPAASSSAEPAVAKASVTDSSTSSSDLHDASRGQSTTTTAAAAELASAKISLYGALRRFADFPIKGVSFIDIMPLFRDPAIHAKLLRALELQALDFVPSTGSSDPSAPWVDVVVGLDARGFLFGPGLALSLGAAFVPMRKKGKLPGTCVTASYEKEYGTDYFQMQDDAITPGQRVIIVDDIIATGGSAAAAAELVHQLGGNLIGYLFILEISFLKGREKLNGMPVVTLLEEAD